MGGLEIALLVAAVLIGATGTWSPCGFSMVETIGPNGHTGGRKVTLAACATFLPGALVGAVVTFAGLALLGAVVPGDGWLRYVLAAVAALAAAVAEARGARLAPQIRRQLPEHWRRVMPMPLAAALYGVLLGLGFTTFVLTFGVWALAGIVLALGEPVLGLAIGLAFGIGRALPVVALAPIADRPAGRAAVTMMAERPGLYRGIRLGDAAALAATGGALLLAAGAEAQVREVDPGADPSVQGKKVVSQRGNDVSAQLHDGQDPPEDLLGSHPAIGGPFIAVIAGNEVVLLDRTDLTERDRVGVRGADAVDVSATWLAVRSRVERRDRIRAFPLGPDGTIGKGRHVGAAGPPAQLGRPSIGGHRVAFAVAKQKRNRIVLHRLKTGNTRGVMGSPTHALSNPSLQGAAMLYVRSTDKRRHQLRIRNLKRGGNRNLHSGRTRLWSTDLTRTRAYVTVMKGRRAHSKIASVAR